MNNDVNCSDIDMHVTYNVYTVKLNKDRMLAPANFYRRHGNSFYSFIHSFVVFNKKVDYHGPPTVSLSNDDACSVTYTPPGQIGRLNLQALTVIFFSATLLYHGNTRGLNLKNWAPRTSSLEADI